MCTPSLALHLIEKAPEIMGEGVKALGFKILLCGAEPGAGRARGPLGRAGQYASFPPGPVCVP